jgi:transposase-like protein
MRRDSVTGERMLEILLSGVSTRRYERMIPEMAETVGVSRSAVSREAIEASEAALKKLAERRFEDVDLLVIYIDGMHFGEQCVLAAIGVDSQGGKHVLGLREGATENAEAAKDLLDQLVAQGVDPKRGGCLSLTDPRRYAQPSTRYSASIRSSAVGTINSVTCWGACLAISRRRRPH